METYIQETHDKIGSWREKFDLYLDKAEKLYLKSNRTSVLQYFYMTIKAHKTPWWMQPITACRNLILSHLCTLVNRWLNQVVVTMPTYIKNSAELKNHFDSLKLPANAKLFTADAVSMYTNINTDASLTEIAQYL